MSEEQTDEYRDYTESLKTWLMQEHGLNEATAVVSAGGIMIGLSIWQRHPEYAQVMFDLTQTDIMNRAGSSVAAFGLMAHATGDERIAPEQMADWIAESIPLSLDLYFCR